MSLKTNVHNVERIFTCHHLTKLWQEVVNLKNEIEKKEAVRLFGEEFHTPSHIFLCIENASHLQTQNGHTKLLMALAKLAHVVPILICQNPFYKPQAFQSC
jgi:3,4-dihydroxy-2-butanone 4-phosphate synthase